MSELKNVVIYTDGGALGNPGPGGYGVVMEYGEHRREISGGFRHTTNNRMELLAAIEALKALKYPCKVTLYTDSRYIVDAVTKGWAKRWQAKGWMRGKDQPALNPDLWEKLLELCDYHQVDLVWVKGHSGNSGNERCDDLVKLAASQPDLPADEVYETTQQEAA
ncbi:MAG: ribonuclease HI [Anaerolineae bacterium]|nr:ribonuclease HI [Anaerolineae bacterium]